MNLEPKEYTISIVFRGNFQPEMYQPFWLASNNLIRKDSAEAAEVEVIHTDVSRVAYPNFVLEVLKDRMVIRTSDEWHEGAIRDIASGILSVNSSLNLIQLGINYDSVFKIDDTNVLESLNQWMRPSLPTIPELDNRDVRMVETTMRIFNSKTGYLQLALKLESKKRDSLFIANINNHFDFHTNNVAIQHASDILQNDFDRLMTSSKQMAKNLLSIEIK